MRYKNALSFLLGFLSCAAIFFILLYMPSFTGFSIQDQETPSDRINESAILLYPDKLVLDLPNITISSYYDTGSMDPLIYSGASGIRIKPVSPENVSVGDIVSFRTKNGELVVHRVLEKGIDSKGIYFITKGDQNLFTDGKIRFEEIEYITVGVLW